jgi:S1-C subfamily serine protease
MFRTFSLLLPALSLFLLPQVPVAQQNDDSEKTYLGARVDQRLPANASGVSVHDVAPNGPADRAGLQAGDIITKLDNQPIGKADDLIERVHKHRAGEKVTLGILRDGKEKNLTVTLEAQLPAPRAQDRRPGDQDADDEDQRPSQRSTSQPEGFLGVETRPDMRGGPARRGEGVLITGVMNDSPAAKAGLKRGDLITKVDGRTITNPGDLRRAIAGKRPGQDASITIRRDDQEKQLTARLVEAPPESRTFSPMPELPEMPRFGGTDRRIQQLERRIEELERRLDTLERQKK